MSTSCLSSCTDLGVCRVDTVQFLQHNNIFPLFKYIVQEELPPSVMWSALALESLSWSPQALPLLGIGGVSGSFLEKPVTPLRYRDFAVQIQRKWTTWEGDRNELYRSRVVKEQGLAGATPRKEHWLPAHNIQRQRSSRACEVGFKWLSICKSWFTIPVLKLG